MGTIKSTQKSQRSRSLDIRSSTSWATQGADDSSEHSFGEGLTFLKQPPPLSVRLAPSRGLHLHPIAASTRAVRRVSPLRNDTFEPMAFGRPQQSGAVFERFDQVEAWNVGSADQAHQPTPAFDQRERLALQRLPVQPITAALVLKTVNVPV